jgi:purine-binding chemotaxis protein CheW
MFWIQGPAMSGAPQVVTLRCGEACFGVGIERVREIVLVPDITPVPESGDFIRGIINLRGRILPVLDLGPRLGLGGGPPERTGRIVVVEQDSDHVVGLLVDDASEVLRIPEGRTAPPPELSGGPLAASVRSVARLDDRLILLLDLDRVLAADAARGVAREVTP